MIKKIFIAASLAFGMSLSAIASNDFLSDILGKVSSGVNAGNILSDVIDGVFSKENLSVEDIAGNWQSTGSSVDFRSEDFLKKAGGSAITSSIEQKIDPYYKKYGLDKAAITIKNDGSISIKAGKYTLSGTIKVNDKEHYAGNFIVNFKALGVMSLGEYDTYVTLTNIPLTGKKNLDIMFDAQKLVAIMKALASMTKSSLAKSASSMIESYDGVCVGFKCVPVK